MSVEIPGATPEFKEGMTGLTDLVVRLMTANGYDSDVAEEYGRVVGSYAGEITLTALRNAGLLRAYFNVDRFNEAVADLEVEMGLAEKTAEITVNGSSH